MEAQAVFQSLTTIEPAMCDAKQPPNVQTSRALVKSVVKKPITEPPRMKDSVPAVKLLGTKFFS